MTRPLARLAAVIGLTAGLVGGTTPVVSAAAHRPAPLPAERLQAALLADADLPAEFILLTENPGVARYLDGDRACERLVRRQSEFIANTAPGAHATAETFYSDLVGSFVWQGLGSFHRPWATLNFLQLSHDFSECESYRMELDGGDIAVITQLEVKPSHAGDLGVLARFRSTIGSVVIDATTITATVGGNLVMVNGSTPGRPDLVEELATTAVAKIPRR